MKYFRFGFFRSAVVDGAPAVAPEPEVQVNDDGTVTLFEPEIEPTTSAAPVADPKPGVTMEDLIELERARSQPQPKPEAPPAPPVFDATQYVVKEGDDAGAIDMKALSSGINDFVAQVVTNAVNRTRQEMAAQYGEPVAQYAVQSAAAAIARKEGLGEAGRAFVEDYLAGLTPQQLKNLPNDTRAVNLLVGAARDRQRQLDAADQPPASPGGGRRGTGTVLRLAVDDPTGMGWAGYCRQVGWNPADPKAIARGKERGILK